MKRKRKMFMKKGRICFLSILLALVLGGCTVQEPDLVEITVIHGWGSNENDHVAMRSIYSDFEKENPNIKVHLISMPTSKDLLRKVGDMILVGEMPDVIFFGGIGNNQIYQYMVKNDLALDLMADI